MVEGTDPKLLFQAAISRAMSALGTQGSLPEESAILVTSLALHRQRHPVGAAEGSASPWTSFRDLDPIKVVEGILDEVEQTLTTRIQRPRLTVTVARQLLSIIDDVYREGSGLSDEFLSIERVKALSSPTEGFSTPGSIASLMVKILDPHPGRSIHDPALGSGGLLLASLDHLQKLGAGRLQLSGTEKIFSLATLAKMNLALRGCSTEAVKDRDAFALADEEQQPKYDYIISNPPVSQFRTDGELSRLGLHPAFKFGPPQRNADFDFIQLAISSLKPGGRALLLVRLRPLFAVGKEQEIRKRLLEAGCIESVVRLPEKLLITTPAACAILVLRPPSYNSTPIRVKLIDASSEFGFDEREKRILTEVNIEKIVSALGSDEPIEGLSIVKAPDDLAAHGYDLLPTTYLQLGPARVNLGENTVMKRITEVADVLHGPSLGSLPAGDSPILQGRDLSQRVIYTEELERKDVSSKADSLLRAIAGDILVQRIGASPSSRYVDQRLHGIAVSDTVYVVRLRKPDEMTARFVVEFLNSTAGRQRLRVDRSTVPTLRKSTLSAVEVPFADLEVMKLALELDDLEGAMHEHLNDAKGLKSELFSINQPHEFVSAFKDLRRRHQSLKVLQLDTEGLATLNAAIGLAALEEAVSVWGRHKECDEESFWRSVLDERPFLFAQLFHFPIVIIRDNAYVGGKRLSNSHGSLADFLAKTKTTGAALIIEIKTPRTNLLAQQYRQDVYPWSSELGGALSQVLHYRSTLTRSILQLREDVDEQLESDLPRCVVIAGNVSTELDTRSKRRSFERIRENLHGVSVVGFDELFGRAAGLIEVLRNPS
jgi:tRNA1(Val) A37 N6-methylase TrmN6